MYGDRKGGRGGGDTRGGGANMGERVASARSLPACVNITSCLYELRGGTHLLSPSVLQLFKSVHELLTRGSYSNVQEASGRRLLHCMFLKYDNCQRFCSG